MAKKTMTKRGLNGKPQQYKNITLSLINRAYGHYSAMRFIMNHTSQNVWIPKKHLEEDGTLKPDQDIDYVFKKHTRQMILAGTRTIGDFIDNDFRVVVAGGREFNNFALLERKLDKMLSKVDKPITIISGGAGGADTLGERYAKKKGYNLVIFCADWQGPLKKGAGFYRNREMAMEAHAVVVFWNMISNGTRNMVNEAEKMERQLRIINYTKY